MTPGKFITFEGGEGAGKSTQVTRLAAALRAQGIEPVLTREPGGAPGAEEIRALLVQGSPSRWAPMTEALLHCAARSDHLELTILPALRQGRWVISDRFADSTMAYQGYGHELGRAPIESLHRVVVGDLAPHLTLILDIPVAEGLKRATLRAGKDNRYERMDVAFHERLRRGFLEIAALEPGRCVVVNAARDVDAVAADVWAAVQSRLLAKG
ncbi:MAG: dTMP kinase [Rhodospirillales bacterium]|nr:dTMP kinase [Rhodospirillales bacterium]MSP81230.1 dTMP kinase [Rhodospirillales bacterium]